MLFEALVAILVFSVGVLGILGTLAVAVKSGSADQYRIDACLLADKLIGQMWADDRTPAILQANYQGGSMIAGAGPDGPKYTAWLADIKNNRSLPGVAEGDVAMPIVTVTVIDGTSPPATAKSQVAVTLYWRLPGEDAPPPAALCYPHPHCYKVVTLIK